MISKIVQKLIHIKLTERDLEWLANDLTLTHYEYAMFVQILFDEGVVQENDSGMYYLNETNYDRLLYDIEMGTSVHTYENCLRRQGLL
jgi:hypothetical protein